MVTQQMTTDIKAPSCRRDTLQSISGCLRSRKNSPKMNRLSFLVVLAILVSGSQQFSFQRKSLREKCPPKPDLISEFDKTRVSTSQGKKMRFLGSAEELES